MGAVAGAEPASEIAGFANGDAAEVCADACFHILCQCVVLDEGKWSSVGGVFWERGGGGRGHHTQHDEPFRLLDAVRVRLGIT